MVDQEERFQILSLSGGGVRGLYTISILAELEKTLAEKDQNEHYNIADHFDLISGTSIGGILALGLASGINARTLASLIDEERTKIFKKTCIQKIPFLGTLCKQARTSLYSSKPLKNILKKEFGEKKIRDLNTRVVIPSVNGTTGLPKVYKTPHHCDFLIDKNLSIVDVGMATSAAPTYFDPQMVNDNLMVDGGLVANSPALIAYHEATHFLKKRTETIHLLCIGTMGSQETLNIDRTKCWGYLSGWGMGRKLLGLTLSSNEKLHNFIVKQLLQDRFVELDDHNTPDQSKSITLDNANDAVAIMLKGKGKNKAQFAIGQKNVKAFFTHRKAPVTFFEGGEPYEVQHN
ncbi:CBASS cGAMP-activated phospholipase [Neisseria sp. Ec49-e6-T10]|uniref:CBASS cGAMP-activated phospholipase n=1 Tax=Neisseria sp. Ec49-e6-T10 TaxID=3140744 RepID=UPI003EB91E5E